MRFMAWSTYRVSTESSWRCRVALMGEVRLYGPLVSPTVLFCQYCFNDVAFLAWYDVVHFGMLWDGSASWKAKDKSGTHRNEQRQE
eukprot:3481337-Amphidinium_carterae.1